jgi:predicted metal-dependent peptidase
VRSDLAALETKLAAARTRLILDKPFLGSLVMHLPLKIGDAKWCKTTATDARHFYYNPDYIARLTLEQTQFVLAHEAMHCALSHFNRRNHRQKHRWDVACDYAVNMILDDERMVGPERALMSAAYRGLSAEEIYPLLDQDPDEETLDQHLFDNADSPEGNEGEPEQQDSGNTGEQGQGEEGGQSEGSEGQDSPPQEGGADQQEDRQDTQPTPPMDLEQLDEQWQNRLAAAAQAARQAGKMSQSMLRLVDQLLAPRLPWRAMLARYMMNAARDDYSFQRTSRREGEAMMPRLYSQSVKVLVVLDTSGSVSDEELREFLAEVDALKAQVRAEVTLHACDDKLAEGGPWIFAMWEPLELPEGISGGGGTDFRPVFDWLEQGRTSPDLLVYFTDAEGRFPEAEPTFPVVWLVKGKAPVPYGIRIQLN